MDNTILISGCGSIGKRHARNLRDLGITQLAVCDPSTEQRQEIAKELQCPEYGDFTEALTKEKPQIVFICSPTKFHVEQALLAAKTGAHLFIEKPLSNTMQEIEDLEREVNKRNLTCMVGCNMRFHFGPASVKRLLEDEAIGKVQNAEVYTGSYLPQWRPKQDYRQSYSADPEQGGAILDCIHELDLALWYFGPARLKETRKEVADAIGLTVEGTADLYLAHENGVESHVHLSFIEPEHQRFCRIDGTGGSIVWDIYAKHVYTLNIVGAVTDRVEEPEGYTFDQCYKDEIAHFLDAIDKKSGVYNPLHEAVASLKLALAARAS